MCKTTMHRVAKIVCGCLLCSIACTFKSKSKADWQIAYRRADYFFGSIDIKIGTDSCYYLNQGSIHKNPPIIKWKSSRKKLNALYRQVEKYRLQDLSNVTAVATEQPFESIQLAENGKIVFEIVKHQLTSRDVKKFDSVLAILKIFCSSGKY